MNPANILRFLVLGAVCSAVLAVYCSPGRFPVIRPGIKADRGSIAKIKAEECFVQARNMERYGKYREALALYEMAWRFDPGSQELMKHVVRCYLNAGRLPEAVAVIRNKEKRGTLSSEDYRMLSGIYWKMGDYRSAIESTGRIQEKGDDDYYSLAAMYEKVGDIEKSLVCYNEYSRRKEWPVGLVMKMARMYLSLKLYDSAESLMARLQEEHGEGAELHDLRGTIAMVRGDTAAALACFEEAIAADSLFEAAIRNAAFVYLQKQDYRKATGYYETLYERSGSFRHEYGRTLAMLYHYGGRDEDALRVLLEQADIYMGDPDYHLNLGMVYSARGDIGPARLEMEKSIALNALNPDAWRELVGLLLRESSYAEAAAASERFLKKMPREGSAWRLAGYVISMQKKYSEAVPYFAKAVELDTMDAGAWFELGSCHERSGDIGKAAAAFGRVLALRPGDPAASNYLGYMWAEKGLNLDSAKTLLEAALGKEPSNGAYLDSYAWILFQSGNIDSAYGFMNEAMARIHDDPVVFEHYGDILFKLGDVAGALKAYIRSIEYKNEKPGPVREKAIRCEKMLGDAAQE